MGGRKIEKLQKKSRQKILEYEIKISRDGKFKIRPGGRHPSYATALHISYYLENNGPKSCYLSVKARGGGFHWFGSKRDRLEPKLLAKEIAFTQKLKLTFSFEI